MLVVACFLLSIFVYVVVRYELFVVSCLLSVRAWRLVVLGFVLVGLFVGCWLLIGLDCYTCLLFVVCCLMFVVCCLLCVVLLFVFCVDCSLLFGVRCFVIGV